MQVFRIFVGLWMMTIGVVAMVADDISDDLWWFAATGLIAAGLSGLAAAVRQPSSV